MKTKQDELLAEHAENMLDWRDDAEADEVHLETADALTWLASSTNPHDDICQALTDLAADDAKGFTTLVLCVLTREGLTLAGAQGLSDALTLALMRYARSEIAYRLERDGVLDRLRASRKDRWREQEIDSRSDAERQA